MKAIIRTCAGLLALLLLGSVSHGYVWVSPVFKQPYPVAPSPSNSGFYIVDAWGRLTGPHYYLVPPCQPFNGMLPGKTGAAIQDGYLPHTLLMSKEGLAIGKVPLLGQKHSGGAPESPYPNPGAGLPPPNFGSGGPMMYGAPNPMPISNMQVPYGGIPQSPYPVQPAYIQPPLPQPMPWAQPMLYPMPYGQPLPMMPYGQPMPMMPYAQPMPQPQKPIAYMPYYGPPGMYATARQDPRTGIWQVQNVMPNQGGAPPFMQIPGFNPATPMPPTMPMTPMMPNMPMTPGMAPNNGFQFYGPVQPFNQLQPMQPFSQFTPMMPMQPLQMPRMDMMPPPPQRPVGGGAYPTHPFTRSPRDFFMWGENMDDERARGNRPFPVP